MTETSPPRTRNEILRDARALVAANDALGALLLLAVESAKAPTDGALRLEYAKRLRLADRHAEALATLAEFSAIAPDFEGLAAAHGAVLDKLGHTEAAAARYAAAIAAQPADRDARWRLASCLRRLGRPAEGQAVIEAGLALAPRNAALLLESARCLTDLGRAAEAMAALDIVAEDKPDHPRLPEARAAVTRTVNGRNARLWLDRARERLKAGDPQGSLAVLEEAALAVPLNGTIRIEQAKLLRRFGRDEEALAVLQALAVREPRHVNLAAEIGPILEKLGREAEAIEAYVRALAAKPEDRLVRRNLAACLRRLGRVDEALGTLEGGLALTPRDGLLLLERARSLADLGRLDEAEAALGIVAADKPDHPGLLDARLLLARLRGDADAAIEAQRLALLATPGDARLCGQYARALGRADKAGEALAVLGAFLETAPDNPGLRLDLAGLLTRFGDLEGAHRVLAEVRLANPEHPRLPDVAARLAEAEGDHAAAAEALRAALLAHPGNAELHTRLVRALRRAGQPDAALAALQADAPLTPPQRAVQVEILLDMSRHAEARALLAEWPPGEPEGAVQRLRSLAFLAERQQDHAAAARHCAAILELAPDHGWALQRLPAMCASAFDTAGGQRALKAWLATQIRRGPRSALRHGTTGHILNELRLRPGQTAALAAAQALAPEERIPIAAALVEGDGESIGPALGLLTAMAQSGRLIGGEVPPPAPGAPRRIPRILHQFWDHEDLPPDVAGLMEQARARNPDHDYRRWSDRTARAFLAECQDARLLQAYRAAKHVAIASDIFRLAVLVEQGGIHLDADDRCQRALETLVPAEAELVVYQETIGSIGNNFIAAVPGHPILRDALAEVCEAMLAGAGESAWLCSGPGVMTRAVARAIAATPGTRLPAGLHVHEHAAISRHVAGYRRLAYKATSQHWSNTL